MMQSIKPVMVAVSVLIVVAMLFAAFVVMAPRTSSNPNLSATSGVASAVSQSAAVCGQVPVPLHSAGAYAVLASSTVTSTGATALTGNLGLSPGTSVTGFPPGTITGLKNVTTPAAAGAEANLTIAINNATGRSNCAVTVAGNIGGQTLTPGLYKSTSSLAISSGDLTLSGGGNPNAVFIFQVASAFTMTSGRTVILSDGAQAGNVFWVMGSSATLGTSSTMMGTVMAHDSVSMLTGSTLTGRAMAATGEVSLADSTIVLPTHSTISTSAVTFTETGLAAATSWSVSFGGTEASSTSSTVVFHVISGTYAYSVNVVGYLASPSSGSLSVSGSSVGQTIVCTTAATGSFEVTFTESGLPSGMGWSMTLNGVLLSSSTGTAVFTEASGTYSYSTGVVSNYTASPSSGSVTVNRAAQSQAIAFTAENGATSPGGPGASGLSSTDWALIGVGVVAVVAAVVGGIALARRRSK